ncbi:MAG: Capsular polysaccharide biosynthesis glycosyl transferase [Modestobacter sp.]|nr:Capsular polysaccharide biosynthesis glycosyl transferase [Modestobacter sp.]
MRGPRRPDRIVYGVTVPESAATLLRGQLAWFRRRGWDVHLVTSPGPLLDTVEARERVITHPLPMNREISPAKDLLALVGWVRLLRRLRPSVINVGTPKAGLLGSIAAWLTRVPVRVYVMRGLRLEGAGSARERRLLWLMERLTVRLATDVVCVSASLLDEATRYRLFGRRDAPRVLAQGSSNGVNPERWDDGLAHVDRQAVRAEWRVGPEDLLVGFVGRVAADKGVADLLDAFARLADLPVRLLLVGPVEDERLVPAIERLGDRVIRIDWTLDLHPVYAAIDVLCLPTRREGFPNVVLEAALAEVPTITTTATGARDSVVPDVTGWLVPVGDVAQLATAIRDRLGNIAAVRTAGKAARKRALRDFRPETIWTGLEEIYRGGPAQLGPRTAPSGGNES